MISPAMMDTFAQCDYVQVMNMGTGSFLTQNWDEGNCLSIQLMSEASPQSQFVYSMNEESSSLWTKADPSIAMSFDGQNVVCSSDPAETMKLDLIPFSEGDVDQGYMIEVIGEQPRFLSTQYGNELRALISLESLEDMKMYATESGDQSSLWQVTCHTEVEETI